MLFLRGGASPLTRWGSGSPPALLSHHLKVTISQIFSITCRI
jgi:hypothetical protein